MTDEPEIYVEVQVFGMITLENGDMTLASSQLDGPEPEFWDVEVRQHNEETGEVDVLEERDHITTIQEACLLAEKWSEKYGTDGYEVV